MNRKKFLQLTTAGIGSSVVVVLGVFSLIFLLAGFKRNHTSFIT